MAENDVAPRKVRRDWRKKSTIKWLYTTPPILIVVLIIVASGQPVTVTTSIAERMVDMSTMEVTGVFDRVELVERYFYDSQEVEGKILAEYHSDTVGMIKIVAEHRRCSVAWGSDGIIIRTYIQDRSYTFFLYVYSNDSPHLREQIIVDGGTIKNYTFNTTTIIISLLGEGVEEYVVRTDNSLDGWYIATGIGTFYMIVVFVFVNKVQRPY